MEPKDYKRQRQLIFRSDLRDYTGGGGGLPEQHLCVENADFLGVK